MFTTGSKLLIGSAAAAALFAVAYGVAQGGTPQGAGTNCATVECPQACCLQDGTCTFIPPTDCTDAGGMPMGYGTNCATVDCPQACCLPDGTCVRLRG